MDQCVPGVLAIVAGHPIWRHCIEGLPNLQGRDRGIQEGAEPNQRWTMSQRAFMRVANSGEMGKAVTWS
jgi:hypothetical protein